MKTSAILVTLALALSAAAVPQQGKGGRFGGFKGNGGKGGFRPGQQGGKGNQGSSKGGKGAAVGGAVAGGAAGAAAGGAVAGAAGSKSSSVAATVTSAAAAVTSTVAASGAADNASNSTAAGGAAADTGDPQTSLTLDPKVIASGFANNGQDVPTAGQVASLTSTNNFINFCLTVPNLPITNGKQITTGSCNPAPIGTIPSVDNMPSAKFVFPPNGDTSLVENTAFTIQMAIANMETGNFVNAQENYFAAPQQLNGNGQIIGHSHVVVETLDSLAQTAPTDPKKFAFFKGLNGAAVGGILTADVTAGLPAGAYRLASINTAANHQPAIVPIAQHGSLDDAVYFTVKAAGAAGAAAPPVASAAAPVAATPAAAGAKAVTATPAAAGAKAAVATPAAVAAKAKGGKRSLKSRLEI